LLRGINVGGHAKVSMSDLRDVVAALGFKGARTLLQSGNLVFSGGARKGAELESLLEKATLGRLNVRTDFFVRTADEWAGIIARNPFSDEAARDPSHLVVMALKGVPTASAVEALRSAVNGPEVIRAAGRQLYVTYPAGIGRSRLNGTLIEAKLGTRATGRNWNTVLKLDALARFAPTANSTP
jgi:uncharacterized protein (DUF1697 family)